METHHKFLNRLWGKNPGISLSQLKYIETVLSFFLMFSGKRSARNLEIYHNKFSKNKQRIVENICPSIYILSTKSTGLFSISSPMKTPLHLNIILKWTGFSPVRTQIKLLICPPLNVNRASSCWDCFCKSETETSRAAGTC